jgi:hypothetical protein
MKSVIYLNILFEILLNSLPRGQGSDSKVARFPERTAVCEFEHFMEVRGMHA